MNSSILAVETLLAAGDVIPRLPGVAGAPLTGRFNYLRPKRRDTWPGFEYDPIARLHRFAMRRRVGGSDT